MYLCDLELHSAPGLASGLRIQQASPGLNLVVGPNASGKSTLARTLRGALLGGPPLHVNATLHYRSTDGESTWQVQAAHGAAQWIPAPPKLPASSAERYALSLGVLLQATRSDTELAQQLSVELAGGYNVDAAMDQVSKGLARQPSRIKEARAVTERAGARRHLEAQAASLAAEEQRLDELNASIEASAQGRAAHQAATWLVELGEARRRTQEFTAQLDPYPDEMARVWPDAVRDLVELQRRSAEAERDKEAAAAALRDAEVAVRSVAFDAHTPTREQLREARSLIQSWDEAIKARMQAEAEWMSARTRRDDALAAIVSRPKEASLSPDALETLESALDALRVYKIAEAEARERLATHPEPQGGAPPGLDEAIHELRKWLRAPSAIGVANPASSARTPGLAAAAAGFVLLLLGLGLYFTGLGPIAGIVMLLGTALLAGGLTAVGLGSLGSPTRSDPRADIASVLAHSPHKPASWAERVVLTRLDELERLQQRVRSDEHKREAHAQARRHAERASKALQVARATFDGAVQATGLSEHFAGLGAVEQARQLERYVRAREDAAAAAGRSEATQEQRDHARARLDAWLTGLGMPPASAPGAAHERIQSLEDQLARLTSAESKLQVAQREVEAAARQAGRVEAEVADLWERVALPPGSAQELRHRVQHLEAYQSLREALDRAEREVRGLESRVVAEAANLERVGVTAPTRVSLDAARELVGRLQAAAERHDNLVDERGQILARLQAARDGSTLSDAVNEEQEAIATLDARRREHLVDDLALKLLQEAQRAHGREAAPPVLQRARDAFATFTHHHYRLAISRSAEGAAVFTATHTPTGGTRDLHELSDATRIQLLLALRLAAIEADEAASGPLPLCLDEVLSTTDPDRFREVGTALLQLTDAGRQVFYFTADPTEVHWWRQLCEDQGRPEPAVHNLGAPRQGSMRLPALPRTPSVPVPEPGQSAEDYLNILGVPQPSGHTPSGWHLGLLLADNLSALRALLLARIDRVGPWKEVRGAGGSVPVPDALGSTLDQRVAWLEATLDAWRVGRGAPVDWSTVEASGAITAAFEERVREAFDAHRHHPRRFFEAVTGLPRFRSHNTEALEATLIEAGNLTSEAPLSRDAIVREALATAGAAPQDAGPWIQRWLTLLDRDE